MPIVDCKNLTITYGSFCVFKNVSFSVENGDYLCIVGTNGSGKTTLLKAILSLVNHQEGNIILDVARIGYLPQQNSIKKDFPATVYEVVASGIVGRHIFLSKDDRAETLNCITQLGLNSIKNSSFASLSGGQKQRVLLARSLCALDLNNATTLSRLLILDEPVTGLDVFITDELYSMLKTLNQKHNVTVIMISHDVHRAVLNAKHILHMNNRVEFFGSSTEYKNTTFFKKIEQTEICGG